jgi:hypothetical protein
MEVFDIAGKLIEFTQKADEFSDDSKKLRMTLNLLKKHLG